MEFPLLIILIVVVVTVVMMIRRNRKDLKEWKFPLEDEDKDNHER